jgi:hypothetical protein
MTLRRHPQFRGLGGKTAPPSSHVYSPSAWNTSNAVKTSVKQLQSHPLLAGARYEERAFHRAKAQATSIVESIADMAGTTSLTKEDVQQLILGGLNTLAHAANMLGFLALTQGSEARAMETRLITAMDELAGRTNALVRGAEQAGTLQGLGFIMIALVVGLIAYYLGANDQTTAVMRDVCTQFPDSEACRQMINNRGEWDPTRPASEAAGKLIWWVGIGAAVLVGGYLLFTFGPALGSASASVRSRSAGRSRGRRSLRGPKRVRDLDGPSLYNLEV